MIVKEEIVDLKHPLGRMEKLHVTYLNTEIGEMITLRNGNPNKKSSFSNALNYFIPIIIRNYGADLETVSVIYVSDSNNEKQDDKYFEVQFVRNITSKRLGDGIAMHVRLSNPSMQPITSAMALELESSGLELSQYKGKDITVQTITEGDVSGKVEYYDGSSYILKTPDSTDFRAVKGQVKKVR